MPSNGTSTCRRTGPIPQSRIFHSSYLVVHGRNITADFDPFHVCLTDHIACQEMHCRRRFRAFLHGELKRVLERTVGCAYAHVAAPRWIICDGAPAYPDAMDTYIMNLHRHDTMISYSSSISRLNCAAIGRHVLKTGRSLLFIMSKANSVNGEGYHTCPV
jgi:hypothetical protein